MSDRKGANCESGIDFVGGLPVRFGDVDCVQHFLLLRGKRYAQQNNGGVTTGLPDVALNGLDSGGVILALKQVAAFEMKDNRFGKFI